MKTQSRIPIGIRSALLLTAAALPMPAFADLTWNSAGVSNDWSTAAANWLPGNVAWAQNENAIFNAGPETVTVTTPNTFNDMTFGVGGFTIAGGAGSFNLANDQASTITVTNAADTATISETMANNTAGLSSLTKAGAGTLVLSGANTHTGQTLVTAGTLKLGNAAALGAGGAAAETVVSSGATVDLNAQAVTNTEIFRIAGTGVGGAGALINAGADQQNAVNRLELTADATIGGRGRFDVRPGTLPKLDLAGNTLTKVGGNQVALVGADVTSGNIVINGGIFSIETTTTVGGTGTITVNNGGTLGVWGNTGAGVTRPIVANAGGIITNLGNASSIDSNITLNGPVIFSGTAAQTYLGVVSGTGSINKTGTTTLILGGTVAGGMNTFTGATTSTGGILALDYSVSDTSKLADGAALTLNSSTLQMTGATGVHPEVVGPVTINGVSAITFTGSNFATIGLGNYVANGLLNVQVVDLATTTKANNAQGYLPHTLFAGTELAANDGTGKIIAASGITYTEVTNLSSGTKTIPSTAGSMIRTVEGSGTAGNILLGSPTTDIQSIFHSALTATTVDFGGQTLRLAANGELISAVGSSAVTLQNGSLTAGGAADTPGNIFIGNAGTNAPVVLAKITNNGTGAVSLSTAGNVTLGNTVAASTNDYSGGTTVTGGTLTVASPIAAGAKSGLGTGPVTVNPGGNLRIFTAGTANGQSYANNINLNDATLTSEDGVVTYGGTITLSGTNTVNAYYADNKSALFNNATNSITGTGNLVTTGTSIILSGVNTYTGTTRAALGNLQFEKLVSFYNNTPASWTATNLTVAPGATATFNVGGAGEFTSANLDAIKTLGTMSGGFLSGSNLGINTANAGGTFTYASSITNTNDGVNALGVMKRGNNLLVLSGAHTYTGTTGVIQGVMEVSGSLVAGSALSTAGGTTLRIAGTGILGGGTHTAAVANAGTLQHSSSSNQTFSGVISGGGNFLKDTSTTSTVTFNANHTYTGATTVNAGTLTISGQLRGSSGFNVGPGATMSVTATNVFTLDHAAAMANTRVFTVDGGTLLFTNTGENRIGSVTLRNGATWTSNRAVTGWDYLLANLSTGGAATIKVENTGGSTAASLMNGTGGIHLQGVQNFDVSNVTVSPATDLTVSMILGAQGNANGAAGGINKTGTGTMTLAAANTYTGVTTVAVGTLLVNGSTNAGSAVSVSTDATLGGTGTVNGTVNVAAGGIIAPGANAVGTLATGATTTDGIYACEINGATADRLNVTGNLDIDGASLNVSILSAPTQPEYIIATYTGTRTGVFNGFAEGATVTTGYTITYATAGQIKLVAATGPNYTSWASTFTPNPGAAGLDQDVDGFENGTEFILGGSPVSGSDNAKIYSFTADSSDGDTDKELIMTIAVPVGTPAFSAGTVGTPESTASFAGFGISVRGSTTLTSFPVIVTPVTPYTTGLPAAPFVKGGVSYEYRSFSLGGSNGLTGKGFLQVSVTNP